MTRRARFRQADVTRAVMGAQAAGLPIHSVVIDPNGSISIKFGQGAPATGANEWDEVLKP